MEESNIGRSDKDRVPEPPAAGVSPDNPLLRDYSEYSGLPIEVITERCRSAAEKAACEWNELPGSWGEKAARFYGSSETYIYDLLCSNCDPAAVEGKFRSAGVWDLICSARSVLEFGGGIGVLASLIHRSDPSMRTIYLDLPGEASKFAFFRFQKHGDRIPMIISDPARTRFRYEEIRDSFLLPAGASLPSQEDLSFDLIVSDAVLEHIPEECAVLEGLLDLLNPGGCLVLLVDQEVSPRYPMHKRSQHIELLEHLPLTRIAADRFPVRSEFVGWWESGTISVWQKTPAPGPAIHRSFDSGLSCRGPRWPQSLRFGNLFTLDSYLEEDPADARREARLREEIRVMIGRPSPVLSHEYRDAREKVRRVLSSADLLDGLAPIREQVEDVFCALVGILHASAGREQDRRMHSRLRSLLRMARLILPAKRPEIEVLDIGGYRGFLIDIIRKRLRRWPNYLCIDAHPIENPYGVSVTPMDSTQLTLGDNSVHQTYCLDVLEHMRNRDQVRRTIGEIARVTADYAYIECPNFEESGYLRGLGLKWFWSDWTDHTLPITLSLLEEVVADLSLDDIATVGYRETVYSSAHPQMVRQDAPKDTHAESADLESFRPTTEIPFDRAIHNRVFLRIQKNPFTVPFWESNHPASDLDPEGSDSTAADPARTRALMAGLLGEPMEPDTDLAAFAQGAVEVMKGGAEAFIAKHGRASARRLLAFLCVGRAQAERSKNLPEADAIRAMGRDLELRLAKQADAPDGL